MQEEAKDLHKKMTEKMDAVNAVLDIEVAVVFLFCNLYFVMSMIVFFTQEGLTDPPNFCPLCSFTALLV